MISGTVTSFTVLLIVVFLFREGLALFNTSPLEHHNVIVVNKNNPIDQLSAEEIKKIFDSEITNWNEIGGKNEPMLTFTINNLGDYFSEEEIGADFEYLPEKLNLLVDSIPNILAVYPDTYLTKDIKGKLVRVDQNNIRDFLLWMDWYQTAEPEVYIGVII